MSIPLKLKEKYEKKLISVFNKARYTDAHKITDTLQGSIWRAKKHLPNKQSRSVVIKVTNKTLHDESIIFVGGNKHFICENIINEKKILKLLSNDINTSSCITKYIEFFRSNLNYYLVMEDGGHSLFDFIVRAHQYISSSQISVKEWHKFVRVMFKQLINIIELIHDRNICHFDISLENMLINDIDVIFEKNKLTGAESIKFCCDDVRILLCDFGLAEIFDNNSFSTSKFCGKPNYKSPEINNQKYNFNAKKNDIWCLGVCLFMMITGGIPWLKASKDDPSFIKIINGKIIQLFKEWNILHYVDNNLCDLLTKIFKYEDQRISLQQIKQHPWLK